MLDKTGMVDLEISYQMAVLGNAFTQSLCLRNTKLIDWRKWYCRCLVKAYQVAVCATCGVQRRSKG